MSYIECSDIKKIYKMGEIEIPALNGADFALEKGELCVILGPSGAGKTTLLNIIGGMDTSTSGSLIIDGKDISSFNKKQLTEYRRKDVGFVFQFYNLIPNLTALENVELGAEISKSGKGGVTAAAEEALKAVNLEDRMHNFPSQLSGGEQQRVSIARALAKKPKLLLCDEPTGALDFNTGKNILKLLEDTAENQNITVIIITHNTAISKMAKQVIKINNGRVTEVITNDNPLPVEEITW